jgi:hypothetical protein
MNRPKTGILRIAAAAALFLGCSDARPACPQVPAPLVSAPPTSSAPSAAVPPSPATSVATPSPSAPKVRALLVSKEESFAKAAKKELGLSAADFATRWQRWAKANLRVASPAKP